MKVLLQALTRRLARFGEAIRVATGMVLGRARIPLRPSPPYPLTMGNRPKRGPAGKNQGGVIAKFNDGASRVRRKAGEIVVTIAASLLAVRTPHPRVGDKFPRNALFYSRVGCFFPRVGFCCFCLSISIFLFFQRRKERKQEGKGINPNPRDFSVWCKNNPGIFSEIPQFRGTENEAGAVFKIRGALFQQKILMNQRLTRCLRGNLARFPHSPEKNSVCPAAKVRNER